MKYTGPENAESKQVLDEEAPIDTNSIKSPSIMFDGHEDFEVPYEERLYILPKPRQQLFLNLVENYKIFCPHIKMIYATLNFDKELKVDYMVIFQAQQKGTNLILWDAPYAFTNRAIPAYRYAVKTNQHQAFFRECMKKFCQMEEQKFRQFLQSPNCGNLSLSSKSPKYWKLPENSHSLIEGMCEIGLLFKPMGFQNKHKLRTNI